MGACYSVDAKIKFKDEEAKANAMKELKEYIEKNLPHCIRGENINEFDGQMELILAFHQENCESYEEKGYKWYISAFNATYSWESVLYDVKDILKKYITSKSHFYIEYWG